METNKKIEDILNLNIKKLQFGSSLTKKEKQEHIDSTYNSLTNLALALNISKDFIGLGNTITYGLKGKSGSKAHYEKDKFIINLNRKNGAGSLAHEWAHSLDNYVANVFNMKGLANDTIVFLRLDKFKKLMRGLRYCEDGSYTYFCLNAFTKEIEEGKLYWSKDEELFARALTSYIKDKLTDIGITDDYLCGDCDNKLFPKESEKPCFNKLFDDMFDELKYWCVIKKSD